jgi:alanine racemase
LNFPRATLDLDALRHNLALVRRLAPQSRVLAAVKANAYGHGLIPVARALSSADALGVARLEEALALRAAGLALPLVLLEGVVSVEDLHAAAAHRLDVVVHSWDQIAMLDALAGGQQLDVWLKLDTGMHRLGLMPGDFLAAHQRVVNSKVARTVRVMTHLASAEVRGNASTHRQLEIFEASVAGCGLERSIANSAGLIAWPAARLEWVRPGVMLYGISPMPDLSAAELGLRPAMTLSTRLIAINAVKAGESVGYGGLWRASRDSLIGVASIGYGDGYPRHLPSGAPVLVNGREATLAGRVSMDLSTIDVTDLAEARVGAQVVLWGQGLPIERIAQCAGTISYELACRIAGRVHREIGGE